jgi:crotonobetainyl-CoA:carnitine CoA-transferase CaiB-like acyl-CoA transferase
VIADELLADLLVVDFSELLPGPFFTQNLVDLGARVTKVERPGGDNARALGPGLFAAVNRGKVHVTADLRDDADRCRVDELVAAADVVVEGFRPGVLERLGFGPRALMDRHPRLVYVSLSGFGQQGRLAGEPGHDNTYAAYAGVLSLAGRPGGAPEWGPGVPVADLCAALYATSATLAALRRRDRTGRGAHVDVAIRDCLAHWLNPRLGGFAHNDLRDVAAQRTGALSRPGYGTFTCADGTSIAIAAIEDHFWAGLVRELELTAWADPGWATHAARRTATAEINAAIADAVSVRDGRALVARLSSCGVPVAPVLTPDDALDAAEADGQDRVLRHPEIGRLYRFPVRFTP